MPNQRSPLDMDAETFRALGHAMVDRLADFIGAIDQWPAAPDLTPEAVRAKLPPDGLPELGSDDAALIEDAMSLVLGGARINGHPKSWGYIIGSPAPIGMLGDLLASVANPNVPAWDSAPVPTEIESQTVRWIAELIGFPSGGSGLFVSGGNMANMVGILAARRRAGGEAIRSAGVGVAPGLTLYASRATHTWVEKAVDIAGLGADAIRWIEADGDERMATRDLRDKIDADRRGGRKPFAIVGSAGTVSTGAVDPLPELAEIARQADAWFHVDGAYGGFSAAGSNVPDDIYGLAMADSVAVDAHKWLFAPLEAGVALVRDANALSDAFAFDPPYYHHRDGDDITHYFRLGPQNSRCFRALKAWLILRRIGRLAFAAEIDRDIALARRLAENVANASDFEGRTRQLSIATFRYVGGGGLDDAALDGLNRAILTKVQRGGEAHISNAVLDGAFYLRACVTNFRTQAADIDALLDIVRRAADDVRRES